MRKTFAAVLLSLMASLSSAQDPPQATVGAVQRDPVTLTGSSIGDIAPDFALAGAMRYGLLKDPVRLSDFRGSTVVLAFFYQARTKG